MNIHQTAEGIVKHIGGPENIQDLSHCFTRLRLVLRDESKADQEAIARLEGVIQVVRSGGQLQVVLGSNVIKVYDALIPLTDSGDGGEAGGDEEAGGGPDKGG